MTRKKNTRESILEKDDTEYLRQYGIQRVSLKLVTCKICYTLYLIKDYTCMYIRWFGVIILYRFCTE